MFLNLLWIKDVRKDSFKFTFRFLPFSEISEISETHSHKKSNLQYNREIKISQIMTNFDQTAKLKCHEM